MTSGQTARMTDGPPAHDHEIEPWTDEAWEDWKDYADVVTIDVRFKSWLGADDNDESWLVEADGAAWSKDWLTRQLVELAAADAANSCCGRGNYALDTRDRKTEWGASGAAFEAVLTLSENLLSEATWVALGALAHNLHTRLKQRQGWPDLEELFDERVRETAMWTVVRSRGALFADLEVKSTASADSGVVLVEIRDRSSGVVYTVETKMAGSSVRLSRIRKVAEPEAGDGSAQGDGEPA